MGRPELMGIVMGFLALLLLLMVLGWQARKRRQSALALPESIPTDPGAVRGVFEGLYVATTVAGEPLNRIAVRGLGFRAKATITVAEGGIALELKGERDAFIPAADIRDATRANLAIDRVVETGGLVLVGWSVGGAGLDTYLRVDDTVALLTAIQSIIRTTAGSEA